MHNKERLVSIVKAYSTGVPDSVVVSLPKDVRLLTGADKGTKFQVKIDERNRVIYEPIPVQELLDR